jgi:hypothetical protein
MGQQQLLLIILGVIIVGFAIAVGLGLFSAQSVSSNRDAMINDLNHIGVVAYEYRISLRRLGGGEGDYTDFNVPSAMARNNNGKYSVIDAQVNSVTLKGTSATDSANTIVVTVDINGRLGNLTFTGDFQ